MDGDSLYWATTHWLNHVVKRVPEHLLTLSWIDCDKYNPLLWASTFSKGHTNPHNVFPVFDGHAEVTKQILNESYRSIFAFMAKMFKYRGDNSILDTLERTIPCFHVVMTKQGKRVRAYQFHERMKEVN